MTDELLIDWDAVRKKSAIRIASTRSSDLESMLDAACEKTIFDLKQVFRKHSLPPEVLQEIVTEMVRRFTGHWKEALENQNLAGLIEIVLEGQHLSPKDLRAYLVALPDTFIERVCDSAIGGPASGIHAVIAIEKARRLRKVTYEIIEIAGRFCLKCVDLEKDVEFDIFLGDPIGEIR